jgi:hypothetical protein
MLVITEASMAQGSRGRAGAWAAALAAGLLCTGCGSNGTTLPDDAGAADARGDVGGDATPPGDAATDAGADAGADAACVDPCPAPRGGVVWGCEKRFLYGVNYAWLNFATDFGGLADWGQSGVAANQAAYLADLQEMRAHGASVIRWWVFPDFRSDGIVFDGSDSPTALGATVVADVDAALSLAEQAGVFVMLTIFSFDNFRPGETVEGVWVPGIHPMIVDNTKRTALLQNVVRPLALAVKQSPNAHRMIAWDVINEPEWAISGSSPYGDEDYTPTAGLETLTHTEMESFIGAVIGVLRSVSDVPLVNVGAAAFKWAHAWKLLDTDFHQFHMYKWINDWWPYTLTPAQLELDDKPLVMGEFPMDQLDTTPYSTVIGTWWDNGYSGGMSWQYNEATAAGLDDVKTFADLHLCETRYGVNGSALLPSRAHVETRGAHPSRRRCGRDADGLPVCVAIP